MADFDSPWKEALDIYFQAFLAFFFASIHDDIDWSRGFESLDKELQQIAPKAAHRRRYVDKLVKVWRKNGREVWVLLHVEVQMQRQRGFGRRMYMYNYRIFDRYDRNPNTGEPTGLTARTAVAEQAIHHTPGNASHIVLPVAKRR